MVAPWLVKTLFVVGTLVMFLVGGGTAVHGISSLHHAIEYFAQQQSTLTSLMLPTLPNLMLGFITGGIVVLLIKAVARMRGTSR